MDAAVQSEWSSTMDNQVNDIPCKIDELSAAELELACGGTSSFIHTLANIIKNRPGGGPTGGGNAPDLYEG